MPIHNEERLLPFSLPSVYELNPDEVVLLFDWCSDRSLDVALNIASRFGMRERTVCCDVDSRKSSYRWSHSFGRCYGSEVAKYNVVLFTAADMILDKKIGAYVELIGKDNVALISFVHKNYPVDWRLLVKRLLVKTKTRGLGKDRWLGAIMLFDKRCAFECESKESLNKVVNAQDTHLQMAVATKYKTLCFNSDTVHLRPMESKRHYLRGRLYWVDLKRSFLVTLLSSVMVLRLNLLKGYIHARFGE